MNLQNPARSVLGNVPGLNGALDKILGRLNAVWAVEHQTDGTHTVRVLRLKAYTVATLPTGTQGDVAYVTDATAPTFLAALTGGGSVVTPVFYNGTAWVSY